MSISERPACIEDRAVSGLWEGELLFGDAYSQIATLVLISPFGRVLMPDSKLKRFDETGGGINALTYFDQRVTTTACSWALAAS